MVVEQSQNYSGPPSPSSGKAPPLPWFLGRCPSRSLNFQRSYPTVWVLGWAGQAWVSGGSKGLVASHQAVAGTWLESARNPQILRPLPGTVQAQQHRFLLGERSEFRSATHTRLQVSGSDKSPSPDGVLPASGFSSQQTQFHSPRPPKVPPRLERRCSIQEEGRCSRWRGPKLLT